MDMDPLHRREIYDKAKRFEERVEGVGSKGAGAWSLPGLGAWV
jgi:hypothetical protein